MSDDSRTPENNSSDEMPPKKPNYTFTQDQFEALMSRLGTKEQSQPQPVKTGNFAKCTSRFDGSTKTDVEPFIDAILIYKDCAGVTDENALRGLPMLLEGNAASWWRGVKDDVQTWQSSIEALRSVFSKKLPPHRVFREIFSREQSENENTELFISRFRELIAQLPYKVAEIQQLDMLYGLLCRTVRKRIVRTQFESFTKLIECIRDVEASVHGEERIEFVPKEENSSSKRTRCVYCKKFGHDVTVCRNKKTQEEAKPRLNETKPIVAPTRSLYCYGCNRPGVTKAKCPKCSPQPSGSSADVQSVDILGSELTEAKVADARLWIDFKIGELEATGLADTGSTRSLVSSLLFEKLRSLYVFTRRGIELALADGTRSQTEILEATIKIQIAHKLVTLTFVALPDRTVTRTILGIDFLRLAGIVMDAAENTWRFREDSGDISTSSKVACDALEQTEDPSEARQQVLAALLAANEDIFRPGGDPSPYTEHAIQLKPNQLPIAVPPYRMPKQKREILKQQVDKLLEEGIIEECESAWSAPAVLVPKKNGEWRLCVDYRRLNDITTGDAYPMPRIDDLLHSTKKGCYMSSLDLRSGFHLIKVREEDQDKTAFVTPFGMFRYKRMPFGLKNAPATFQRLMDRFKTGLDVQVLVYLDDLLVISESFQEHIQDLQKVFDRLRQFHLKANMEKCFFVRPEIKYLGHVLTQQGIKVDPKKIAAILEIPEPTNLKHLKSFLQTCSWYRKFIPEFSSVAEPLTSLTKKGAAWKWENREREAFDKLKTALTTAPILTQADETKPYTLRTDASGYALGAVLLQGEGNEERPVEYASRLLTAAERNYNTTEREALAVVWALEKFRGYIECSKINVLTDHQPLRWLMSLKSPTGRLARWALQIQAYDLKISYTPGKANVIADTLSRPSCSPGTEGSCDLCTVSVELPRRGPAEVRKGQLDDPELAKVINDLETEPPAEGTTNWSQRGYMMSQGVLYRYDSDSESEEPQLVVPREERKLILLEYHDAPTASHDGIERTLDRIRKKYFWIGMRRDVENHVKSCTACQKYKPATWKPAGLLLTPPSSQRFEVVAIDFFGPLPETNNGNRWILVVEDTTSKWVELFPMPHATAVNTARIIAEEICLRYGVPRKLVSDNGVQFVSAVVQQLCYCLGIHQSLIPLYHAESNPVERKNRDLKPRLAILVGKEHTTWDEKIPAIRFAMNTGRCESTGFTPAFMTFGRELRRAEEIKRDLRTIVENDTVVPEITPYLKKLGTYLADAKEKCMTEQDRRKAYVDRHRAPAPVYNEGDQVLVKTHLLSQAAQGLTSKFVPKRDGPYIIKKIVSPTSFELAEPSKANIIVGKYHSSELVPYVPDRRAEQHEPIYPLRKRGRPRKNTPQEETRRPRGRPPRTDPGSSARAPTRNLRGRM